MRPGVFYPVSFSSSLSAVSQATCGSSQPGTLRCNGKLGSTYSEKHPPSDPWFHPGWPLPRVRGATFASPMPLVFKDLLGSRAEECLLLVLHGVRGAPSLDLPARVYLSKSSLTRKKSFLGRLSSAVDLSPSLFLYGWPSHFTSRHWGLLFGAS